MIVTESDEAARETLARAALQEFTRPGDVGPLIDEVSDDGVWTLRFVATTPGYPGWRWTVSLAQLEGADPTVLETELIPDAGALLAPEWLPWSTRLEEWRAQQAASGASDADDDSASEDEHDDESDEDDESDGDDDEADRDDDLGDDVYDGLDPEAALDEDEDEDEAREGGQNED